MEVGCKNRNKKVIGNAGSASKLGPLVTCHYKTVYNHKGERKDNSVNNKYEYEIVRIMIYFILFLF